MGSFRHHGCYDFVRTDQTGWDLLDIMDVNQRGWDLLDIMDVMTLYALTRGGGIFSTSWMCFVRTDPRGWDLLDITDVVTL